MDFAARANWWVSSLSQTCLKRESSVSPSMTFAIWGVREIGRRSCSTTLGGEHFGTGTTSDCLRNTGTYPCTIEALEILVMTGESSKANSLQTFPGTGSDPPDLFD